MLIVIVVFKLHDTTLEGIVRIPLVLCILALNDHALLHELGRADLGVREERLLILESTNSVYLFRGAAHWAEVGILRALI